MFIYAYMLSFGFYVVLFCSFAGVLNSSSRHQRSRVRPERVSPVKTRRAFSCFKYIFTPRAPAALLKDSFRVAPAKKGKRFFLHRPTTFRNPWHVHAYKTPGSLFAPVFIFFCSGNGTCLDGVLLYPLSGEIC